MNNILTRILLPLLLLSVMTPAMAQLKVFACEPEWAKLVEILGGDKVKVYPATHAGQDVHHVEARPSLIARLRGADLAVCTGAGLEAGWMPMLQRRAKNPGVLPGRAGYFSATEQVALLEKPGRLDRSDGDVHADGNPHIQLDPRRLLQVAGALAERLGTLDTDNRDVYQSRLAAFQQRMENAMIRWQQSLSQLRGRRAIVHHREWVYLLDWLEIERVGSLEPKPGVPASPGHLTALKKLGPVDWIVLSTLNDPKPARWLQDQNHAPIVILPHTVGAIAGADDFVSMFDLILQRLLEQP